MPGPTRLTAPSFTLPSVVTRFCHDSWRKFWADEEGASLVEYVLLVALIAAVCVGAVTLLGTSANAKLNTAAGAIQ